MTTLALVYALPVLLHTCGSAFGSEMLLVYSGMFVRSWLYAYKCVEVVGPMGDMILQYVFEHCFLSCD
jgi:hypothetical protein